MLKKTAFVLALIAAFPALAVKEYYSISRSTRALGMGNAYYGLSNDEYALFYNPAGLSKYRGGTELMFQIRADASPKILSAVKTISNASGKSVGELVNSLNEFQGTPLYANVGPIMPYFMTKNFAIALLVADTKVDFAMLGKELDTSVDLTAISDSGLLIGYSHDVMPDLHIGVTAKGILRAGGKKNFPLLDLAQGTKFDLDPKVLGGAGVGLDFDLGGTYDLPVGLGKDAASLVFTNLLATDFSLARVSGGGAPPGVNRMVTLAYHSELPGFGPFERFDLVADFAEFKLGGESDLNNGARGGSFFKHVNLGVEAPIGNWLFLRAGLRQGYWTAGLGLDARFLKFDIATYEEELGSAPGRLGSRRVAARVVIGIGGSAPAAVERVTEPKVQPSEPKKAPETKPEEAPVVEPMPVVEPKVVEPKKVEPKKAAPKAKPAEARKPQADPEPEPNRGPAQDDDRFGIDN